MKAQQKLLFLLFVLLLSVPMILRVTGERASDVAKSQEESLERFGLYFEDIALQKGVSFRHERCPVDPQLEHIMPQIAAMGASVSIVDVNRDGLEDFYLTTSSFEGQNHLYIQQTDGTFLNKAQEYEVANLNSPEAGASMGAIWADINNDGLEDLFIYRYGKPDLYINISGERFQRMDEAGLPEWVNSNSATWLDYDMDGYIDLFLTGYFHEEVDLFDLKDIRMMPDSYEYATNGARNYLLRNLQGQGFEDVTEKAGLDSRKWTLAVTSVDIDHSGTPDLILANDYGVDELFLNLDGTRFVSVGEEAGIGFVPKSGMSVVAADIYNQGEYDLYITNISEAGVLMQGNNLWTNAGTKEQAGIQIPVYVNTATAAGVEIGEWGYSGSVADLDNNGHQDIYVANGFYSATPNTDYWYDYTKVVGANSSIIMDARNWPAMEERTFSGYQTNKLWLNDGSGRFREVATATGAGIQLDSRSVATADLFQDGSLDLLVANQDGEFILLNGTTNPNRQWVQFSLEGTVSNRSAIGASVQIWWTASENGNEITKTQIKAVTGGDAFSSQSSRSLHFGLGEMNTSVIDSALIRWPSGQTQKEISLPILTRYSFTEF